MDIIEYRKRVQQPLRQATLCFLVKDSKVLLAMKKRGHGQGKWNGVGGKLNPGEKIRQAAIRETQEEIEVVTKDIKKRAVLDFYHLHNPAYGQQVTVYLVRNWIGEPRETEEMRPRWFKKDNLPLESMWPDDKLWLPQILAGLKLKAEFLFKEDDTLLDSNIIKIGKLIDI